MSPMRHAVSCVPTHGFWLVVDGLLKSNFVHCLRLDGLISVSQSKHRLLQFLLFCSLPLFAFMLRGQEYLIFQMGLCTGLSHLA